MTFFSRVKASTKKLLKVVHHKVLTSRRNKSSILDSPVLVSPPSPDPFSSTRFHNVVPNSSPAAAVTVDFEDLPHSLGCAERISPRAPRYEEPEHRPNGYPLIVPMDPPKHIISAVPSRTQRGLGLTLPLNVLFPPRSTITAPKDNVSATRRPEHPDDEGIGGSLLPYRDPVLSPPVPSARLVAPVVQPQPPPSSSMSRFFDCLPSYGSSVCDLDKSEAYTALGPSPKISVAKVSDHLAREFSSLTKQEAGPASIVQSWPSFSIFTAQKFNELSFPYNGASDSEKEDDPYATIGRTFNMLVTGESDDDDDT